MKNCRKRILSIATVIGVFISGNITAHAYSIICSGGIHPIPSYVIPHKYFPYSINRAIHNANTEWNNAGFGDLVYRNTDGHETYDFPSFNGKNEITVGNRGDEYLMQTYRVDSD